MLKVKIVDIIKHRSETTFRPYLAAKHLFTDAGIKFVFDGNDYDMAWISQASYFDKNMSYDDSVKYGIEYLEKYNGQDYILFDGQDSATLKGSFDALVHSDAKLLLKNTLYYDRLYYSSFRLPTGRMYWMDEGFNTDNYAINPEVLNSFLSKIKLSGTNWLSTVNFNNFNYKGIKKDIDVFAMFQYPAKPNSEWGIDISKYYTEHRKKCVDWLKLLPKNVNVVTTETGNVPIEQYYNLMSRSKIVVAPFGYGEIAPRDIESAMVGSILIKPDMSHIETIPNIYADPKNYITCYWDFSNLNELILSALEDFEVKQEYYVENMRRAFRTEYQQESMVMHIYNLIKELDGYC